MNGDDDEREEGEGASEGEAEPKEGKAPSLDALRESIREIVDDALGQAMELRGKKRTLKVAIGEDLRHLKSEVRKAVEGATGAICAIDIGNLKEGLKGRTNTLMTRVRDEDLKRMNLLLEAGLFESRSECAAFLIHAGLDARGDLVDKVQETAGKIADLKEQLRKELSGEEGET